MRRLAIASCVAGLLLAVAPVPADTYQYDAAGRLLSVEYGSGKAIGYTYDGAGNLTSLTVQNATAGDGVPGSSLATAWVNFGYGGTELGTQINPFNTGAEGITAVQPNGTVRFVAGTSGETLTIVKPMTLESAGGVVRIGQ